MNLFSREMIDAARGLTPADTVFRNAEVFNPFTCTWESGELAIKDGVVLGIGDYSGATVVDLDGGYLVPGLIDAHVHIESSLLTPKEYARLVAVHGTTTVIADPHEIANVAGGEGIRFMLGERDGACTDIRYMLPSCVPATPADIGGASLDAGALAGFGGCDGVLGLGEMMNVPGVLAADGEIGRKLELAAIRDGHAPHLSGRDLNAYILAGLQSDHECTTLAEAEEKLRRGMYLYIREGSTEQNIAGLVDAVTPETVARCCFATDDRHADALVNEGHIDHCIRRAIECGLEPELAIRMATLSPAERFGLSDRGALSPGRRADFCLIDDPEEFVVRKVFRAGTEVTGTQYSPKSSLGPGSRFGGRPPAPGGIAITGSGEARVIGLVPGQIVTNSLRYGIDSGNIPDFGRDILKLVVCSRYRPGACGVGLVHGFGFRNGAIASSISHDAHNVIGAGTNDADILAAIGEVFRHQGAMAAVAGETRVVLPLDCGGLMSSLPYQEVVRHLGLLSRATSEQMGGIGDPFMYLSFLALTVVPSLRITDRGVFDAETFRDVPLFA
ncbi:MAG TPA: adenine deaminase [Methanoregula sp.]|nr:adenine deaminase [Methanoregula sp.]